MNKIIAFIKKEFIQYKRNTFLLCTNLLLMPLIQLFFYGYTINYDVKNIPMVILNQDHSLISLELCNKFQNTYLFKLKKYIFHRNEINKILTNNESQIILIIPPDFTVNIKHNKQASLQLIVDGSDSNTALISLNNASNIINIFSQELLLNKVSRHPIKITRSPVLESLPQILYNPSQKGIIDMAPGIITTIFFIQLMVVGLNAFSREKEYGTIKQLRLSTLSTKEYLISKVIPVFILGIGMFTFMVISSIILFNLPLRGNIFFIFITSSMFLLSLMSLCFCAVIFTKTSFQVYLFSGFIFIIPFILFSGFFFPIQNMPYILQLISFLNPLRHYLEIITGLTLKGSSIINLRTQFAMLFSISAVLFMAGALSFKKIFE